MANFSQATVRLSPDSKKRFENSRRQAAGIQTDPDISHIKVTSKGRIATAVAQDFGGRPKGKVIVLRSQAVKNCSY